MSLEFLAAKERAAEGGSVGEFQVAADRQTVSDPGYLQAQGLEQLGEVDGGGPSLHVGVQSQDNLSDRPRLDSLQQFSNLQVGRPNPVDRR